MEEEERKVRISEWGPDSIKIEGLRETERKKIEGMIKGHVWVKGKKGGRLKFVDVREKLPDPIQDDAMLPFWRKPQNGEGAQMEFENLTAESYKHSSPSISIQHLCGYNYTPENYRHVAHRLEEYGFECMRSRRGPDGQFWEIWFLPGLFLAKGELAEVIKKDKKPKESELDRALRFLCHNVSFGTLDVCVQRCAMTID